MDEVDPTLTVDARTMPPHETGFADWAVVAHKDDTGFGRMAADARKVLGFGHYFVIPSERLKDHPVDGVSEKWLAKDAPEELVRALLSEVRGLVFFERHSWHPALLRIAREMGVATVCVPMWEWFNGDAPEWRDCDLFVCPTRFTESVVRSYGFKNTAVLPWAVDLEKFAPRRIGGPARQFVHNAGLVDHDDRKGTRDTIRAFRKVDRKDVRLLVRMQKATELPDLDDRIEVRVGNLGSASELYAAGDVCIQPSKMEGLGFMVLEPACCGIPVITTDYPPMNEFILQPEMRCATRWFKRKAYARQWIRHAHLKLPSIPDLARRIEWAAANDMAAISQGNRSWAETVFEPGSLVRTWSDTLLPLHKHRPAAHRP